MEMKVDLTAEEKEELKKVKDAWGDDVYVELAQAVRAKLRQMADELQSYY